MTTDLRETLSLTDIWTLAERESGAYGLADDGLRARVATAVDWINTRGPFRHDQLLPMRKQLQHLLANRLRVMLDRKRYPGISDETIDRPIFIIGFPRAGTTLLHSLLAEDPDVLAPQSWHLYSPSPPPGAGPVVVERIAHAQRQVEDWMDLCPAQKPMHPYIDKGAFQLCEDEELLALDFRIAYAYQFSKVPVLDQLTIFEPDMHAGLRFHREFLQHLQWNTGKNCWVCKGPSVQGNIDALLAAYPDALCVWPHRPMGEMYASLVALTINIYDAITGRVNDWRAQSREIAEGMRIGLDAAMANASIDDPRVMHMSFRDLAADPLTAIRAIYDRQDRTLTPEFAERATAWLASPENAVDRHGRYPYSYEDLGIARQWIDNMFADYHMRFGLT